MDQQQQPTTTTLQQAAQLLERSQQLLRAATLEEGTTTTTAARVRRMTTAQLQRDPVLWAAYTRGWEERTAVFRRAASSDPSPARHQNRSRSPRRVPRPAANNQPTATAPQRPPPRPLMDRPIPAPRTSTMPPPASAANPLPTPHSPPKPRVPAPAAALTARQRRNMQRMREFKEKKASQQHRLEKPAPPPSTVPEATPDTSQPGHVLSNLAVAMGPEVTHTFGATGTTDETSAATPPPEDMEISPEEEARLMSETYDALAEMEAMEVYSHRFYSPPTSPPHD